MMSTSTLDYVTQRTQLTDSPVAFIMDSFTCTYKFPELTIVITTPPIYYCYYFLNANDPWKVYIES